MEEQIEQNKQNKQMLNTILTTVMDMNNFEMLPPPAQTQEELNIIYEHKALVSFKIVITYIFIRDSY